MSGGAHFSVEAAADVAAGSLRQRGGGSFCGVSTDSRSTLAGQAFVALRGPRFDGHDHWRAAVEAGAAALIVEHAQEGVPAAVAEIVVPDAQRALGALARAWRRECAPTVVAITGSVGKTTTKELARAVAAELSPATHATSGNLNNEIGLPLTLLAMPAGTRYAVLELGMNAPGEIARLTAIAEPDVGLVTCVAPVHLEGLGSLEAIAAAKAELYSGLGAGGLAIVPSDSPHAPLLAPYLAASRRRLRFGSEPEDEVRLIDARGCGADGCDVRLSLRGAEIAFRLPLPGVYNAKNAAAAAAVGLAVGAGPTAIARALARPLELHHRSALRELGGWRLYDDCYNANPVAVSAALDALVELAAGAPTLAVLGAMLELGRESPRYHREVGAHAAAAGVGELVVVGEGELAAALAEGALAAGLAAARLVRARTAAEAARAVATRAPRGAWVLVKASRGARLEGVIEELEALSRH